MRIKRTRDEEIPSTIIAKSLRGERVYWTGSDWDSDMTKAKNYTRAKAVKKSVVKKAFVITTGFTH